MLKIFGAAKRYPLVTFLILTKRIENALNWQREDVLKWHPNIWIGTSVENGDYIQRIETLRRIDTPNRFISFEPLIGKVGHVNMEGIAWIITGGESGGNRRYFDKRRALELIQQAHALNIPVMHKQGSAFKPGEDRYLNGWTYDEYPAAWGIDATPQTAPQQLSLFGGEL